MDHPLATLLLVISALGLVVSALVLMADPRRWDNRLFAAMCFVDALTETTRGSLLLDGRPLHDYSVQYVCLIGSIVIGYLTVEFTYSFPFNRRLPSRARWLVIAASAAALFLSMNPGTSAWFRTKSSILYFLPVFAASLYFLFLNFRKLEMSRDLAGIPLVMLAVVLRWIWSMATYLVASRISEPFFRFMLYADATVMIPLTYVLSAIAILRFQLFRVRGVVADVVLYGGVITAILALLYGTIDLALTRASGPNALRAMLVGIALFTPAVFVLGRWVHLKIEERVLCPLDRRRALLRVTPEKIVHETAGMVDPLEIVEVTKRALAEVTTPARVEFLRGPKFPLKASEAAEPHGRGALLPGLAKSLERAEIEYLHRPQAHGLSAEARKDLEATPGELFVPVRRAGMLFGALVVDGERLDRDSISAAGSLAGHLALKLENAALFEQMLSLEGQLEEARRLAALGAFAAAIAHDIRTPLTSVQMNVQILRGKAKLDPDDMEYFDIALEELKRLNSHISELLDYAKPVQMKATPLDLREVVEDAVRGIEPVLCERKLRLEREHAPLLPPVLADANRIRQVLFNLLDNAAQASSQGAAIVLRTRSLDGSRQIALDVSDTGKGIETDHLERIFEPFFTTRADGTGLGLAIARKLVRAHGGEIRVRSSVGEGSTFTVVLPAA